MTAYVDVQFYTEEYLGTIFSATEFPSFALRASAEIDYLTFNRA